MPDRSLSPLKTMAIELLEIKVNVLLSVELFTVYILYHMLPRSTITLSYICFDIASSGVCSIHHHFQIKGEPLFKGWS